MMNTENLNQKAILYWVKMFVPGICSCKELKQFATLDSLFHITLPLDDVVETVYMSALILILAADSRFITELDKLDDSTRPLIEEMIFKSLNRHEAIFSKYQAQKKDIKIYTEDDFTRLETAYYQDLHELQNVKDELEKKRLLLSHVEEKYSFLKQEYNWLQRITQDYEKTIQNDEEIINELENVTENLNKQLAASRKREFNREEYIDRLHNDNETHLVTSTMFETIAMANAKRIKHLQVQVKELEAALAMSDESWGRRIRKYQQINDNHALEISRLNKNYQDCLNEKNRLYDQINLSHTTNTVHPTINSDNEQRWKDLYDKELQRRKQIELQYDLITAETKKGHRLSLQKNAENSENVSELRSVTAELKSVLSEQKKIERRLSLQRNAENVSELHLVTAELKDIISNQKDIENKKNELQFFRNILYGLGYID